MRRAKEWEKGRGGDVNLPLSLSPTLPLSIAAHAFEMTVHPVEVAARAGDDRHGDNFRHVVGVNLLDESAQFIEKIAAAFDQDQPFFGVLDLAVPVIGL